MRPALLLVAAALGAAAFACSTTHSSPQVTEVDAPAAWELSHKPGVLILDVRTSGEFDDGHLRDAKNIPIKSLEARIRELDGLQAAPLLVHCTRGVRSAKASKLLDASGFKSIYHFRGGMDAWLAAGYPVIKEIRR